MANLDKLNEITSGESGWLEKAKKRQENKEWLKHSQKIAVKILRTLRKNKADKTGIGSQKELAEVLDVSPQQINKIVKGRENLTLETISKLEQALNISLIINEIKLKFEQEESASPLNLTIAELRRRAEERKSKMKEFHYDFFTFNESDNLIENSVNYNDFQTKKTKIDYEKFASKEIYTDTGENHLKLAS